jgi:hypothetical protein
MLVDCKLEEQVLLQCANQGHAQLGQPGHCRCSLELAHEKQLQQQFQGTPAIPFPIATSYCILGLQQC